MKADKEIITDVLIVGAGIAGIMAALAAAEEGADVCLASCTKIFSGSSFYPGTWGFGLIGPESLEDVEDLEETIKEVGMDMTDECLVKTLVKSIGDSVEMLKSYGVPLKVAEQKDEKEFIPCFDHKHRNWNGIVQDGAKAALSRKLEEMKVCLLPDTEIVKTVLSEGQVVAGIGINNIGVVRIRCKSMVIATGGLGGLFKYRLNTSDIKAMGHYLALNAGARLVNVEFMQMMPGFLTKAPKTIFNEKIFKYSEFLDPETRDSIFIGYEPEELERLLEIRSTHGPFTSRLDSKEIDLTIFKRFSEDERGVILKYKETIRKNQQEFIRLYFDWLSKNKKLTVDDEVQLGIFYHASNGGIKIDEECRTDVPGLFACGEATGGMHGADRIGGLSTANGLVFGRIAGRQAAVFAEHEYDIVDVPDDIQLSFIPGAKKWISRIQEINFRSAMIERTEEKITAALDELDYIEKMAQETASVTENIQTAGYEEIKETYELMACIQVSKHMLNAILLRRESRGSHYRADYPHIDAAFKYQIATYHDGNGRICCEFQSILRNPEVSYDEK